MKLDCTLKLASNFDHPAFSIAYVGLSDKHEQRQMSNILLEYQQQLI